MSVTRLKKPRTAIILSAMAVTGLTLLAQSVTFAEYPVPTAKSQPFGIAR
jgi:hypothetical protein